MFMERFPLTAEAFADVVRDNDITGKHLELIDGEIVETLPAFGKSSAISARFALFIGMYLLTNPIAHVTDAQGGYKIDRENTYAPDVGVILKSRLKTLPDDSFIPLVPDFIVEVVSVSDIADARKRIEAKQARYLAAGVSLLWYAYPARKAVEVHRPGMPVETVGIEGVLDASPILPGLFVRVRDVMGD
jgi:Uma2 family endonuclease